MWIGLGLVLGTLASPAPPAKLEWVEGADGHLAVRLELPTGPPSIVDWRTALSAYVGSCPASAAPPPMLAVVAVEGESVWLRPRFALDPTHDYCAVFDPSSWAQSSVDAPILVQWTGRVSHREPVFVRVLPAVESLPANALRLYVEFSHPVFARDVHRWVRLRDETRGVWVEDPFVAIPEGLWDRGNRRLTLLFHPGRIKRGVGPNLALGPPLAAGHRYRLLVEAPGASPMSFGFSAAEEDRQGVDPDGWLLQVPQGSNEPLHIQFDEPLDPYLVERWVWVETVDGMAVETVASASLDGAGVELLPRRPWPRSAIELVIDPRIEDLAGNRVHRRFERQVPADANEDAVAEPTPVRMRIRR